MGSSHGWVKLKTVKLEFVASSVNMYLSLRRKSKDWLAKNQDNVSEWGDV